MALITTNFSYLYFQIKLFEETPVIFRTKKMHHFKKIELIITLSALLMITTNMLYSQNHRNNYLQEKEFLAANFKSGDNMDPHIKPLPHPDIFWIDKLELFGLYHTLAKDPIPAPASFLILPDSSIYHTSEITDVFKKLQLSPESQDEAVKYAALAIYCTNRDDHILIKNGLLFGEYESHIQYRNRESVKQLSVNLLNQINDPEAEQRGDYYIVKLSINNFESHEYWKPKLSSLYNISIKIGKGIFEITEKDLIGTSFFE